MFVRDNTTINHIFVSNRRRHTILQGDWSSDVCSSDLASMSVTRSFSTGMLPIGSTVIAPFFARSAASPMRVLQASADLPLMRTPQEPQIAARQEQRKIGRASCREREQNREVAQTADET